MSERQPDSKPRRSKPKRDPADIEAEQALESMPCAGTPPAEFVKKQKKKAAKQQSAIDPQYLETFKYVMLGAGLGLTAYIVYKMFTSGGSESAASLSAVTPNLGTADLNGLE